MRYGVVGFAIFSMVNECADRNGCGKLGSAAYMVIVIVGDEDEIDLAAATTGGYDTSLCCDGGGLGRVAAGETECGGKGSACACAEN